MDRVEMSVLHQHSVRDKYTVLHKEIEIHISSCKLSILWVLIKAWSGRESYTIWKTTIERETYEINVCKQTTVWNGCKCKRKHECMNISFILSIHTPPCQILCALKKKSSIQINNKIPVNELTQNEQNAHDENLSIVWGVWPKSGQYLKTKLWLQ